MVLVATVEAVVLQVSLTVTLLIQVELVVLV
jgi:hypothetical protein